jgi:hypothetical protein
MLGTLRAGLQTRFSAETRFFSFTAFEKNPPFLYPALFQSLSGHPPTPVRIFPFAPSGKLEIAKAFSPQNELEPENSHAKDQPSSPHPRTSRAKKGKTPKFFAPKSGGIFQKKGGAWLGGKNLTRFRLLFAIVFPPAQSGVGRCTYLEKFRAAAVGLIESRNRGCHAPRHRACGAWRRDSLWNRRVAIKPQPFANVSGRSECPVRESKYNQRR